MAREGAPSSFEGIEHGREFGDRLLRALGIEHGKVGRFADLQAIVVEVHELG
jgi:hypothetical protein